MTSYIKKIFKSDVPSSGPGNEQLFVSTKKLTVYGCRLTSGIFPPLAFLMVAILFMLTLSLVIAESVFMFKI